MTIFDKSVNNALVKEWMCGYDEVVSTNRYRCQALHTTPSDPHLQAYEGEKYWIWVIPGGSRLLCSYRFWCRVWELLQMPPPFRMNCTRVDVTMDQLRSTILPVRYPMDVRAYILTGKLIHKFQTWQPVENQVGDVIRMRREPGSLPTARDWCEPSEETLYLGSRQSAAMLRVYDLHGPLRWEFEMKKDGTRNRALPILREIAKRVFGGEGLGEICRELWIGLASELIPVATWSWSELGREAVVDPVKLLDTTLEGALRGAINQYSDIYVSVNDTGNYQRFIDICRRKLIGASRVTRWRHKQTLRRMAAAPASLWESVLSAAPLTA